MTPLSRSGLLNKVGFLLRDRETTAGRATNASLYVLNIVFIGLYIISTYAISTPYTTLIRVIEVGLGIVFLIEYIVRVTSASDPKAEMTDPYTIVDLVAVIPVFVIFGPDIGFLRGFHILRVFRFLRLIMNEQQIFGKSIEIRTVRRLEVSTTILLIFVVATGFIYAVEAPTNPAIENFGDAFYYTVIAVSTVGFGDIVPQTVAGRWVTVVAVLVGFVLVPWLASRLRAPNRNINAAGRTECPRCNETVVIADQYCRHCGCALTESTDTQS